MFTRLEFLEGQLDEAQAERDSLKCSLEQTEASKHDLESQILSLKDSLDITKQEVNSKESEMKVNEAAMKSAQDEVIELKESITRANEFNADEIKKVKEQLEKEISEKNNIQEKLEKNERYCT